MLKIKIGKKCLGILTLVASLVLGVLAFLLSKRIEDLQSLGYAGVFIANLIGSATIILPAPSFGATIAVGAFLNPILTGIFSALGSTLGELTGYYIGMGSGEFVEGNDKRIQKMKIWMDRYGLWVVFVLAAIPNPLFDLAGIVSGASSISVWKYMIAVFSGKLIKFAILAYTGFGILKLFNLAF